MLFDHGIFKGAHETQSAVEYCHIKHRSWKLLIIHIIINTYMTLWLLTTLPYVYMIIYYIFMSWYSGAAEATKNWGGTQCEVGVRRPAGPTAGVRFLGRGQPALAAPAAYKNLAFYSSYLMYFLLYEATVQTLLWHWPTTNSTRNSFFHR